MRIKQHGKVTKRLAALSEIDPELKEQMLLEREKLRVKLIDEQYVSPHDESISFGRMLYIARKQIGMSTEEVSVAAKVPYQEYLNYESGRIIPTSKNQLLNICEALGIDPILGRKERDRAALGVRRLSVLKGTSACVNATKMRNFNIFLPTRIAEWLHGEAALRGITKAGFCALLIAISYRMAMRGLTDPANELEKEFETINKSYAECERLYIYDEDQDAEDQKYFTSSNSTYEWAPECDD